MGCAHNVSVLGVFMRRIYSLFLLVSLHAWADSNRDEIDHIHTNHAQEKFVDGETLEIDSQRFEKFIEGLSNCQIAIISVKGMVCDFCARGIEKTFKRDSSAIKVDVDLSTGKVLIAFIKDVKIDFNDIKEKILSNGQNATDLKVLGI